jgi:ABC-type sugar transport system ATPase subunit
MQELVRMRGINKVFPGVQALKNVDFTVTRGEIVGLVGENGAGKSTLMKVLTGVYQPDGGEIHLEGRPCVLADTGDAHRNGISIIFQELNNCANLNVLDNLFLGKELRTGRTPFLDYRRMRRTAREYFERLGLDIDSDVEMSRLSVAKQQMVEIVKALSYDVRLLIMDEPTSSLSEREIQKLFSIMEDLRAQGISIVFISHKLNEVLRMTSRIVILRDGVNVGELPSHGTGPEKLISHMVGRELNLFRSERKAKPSDEVVLEVEGLSGPPNIRDVSFTLKRGEILGVSGLLGAGRTETALLLLGAVPKDSGTVRLLGKEVRVASPGDALANRIVYLPEDRKTMALVLSMTVRENLTLSIHPKLVRFLNIIRRRLEATITERYVKELRIRVTSGEQIVDNLSGGNQQKVVIAKWLATEPLVLILDEPTRGIDVGAKVEVYRIIDELADAGVSIILISSELEEVLSHSDRVLVMHEGRVKACLDKTEANQESIMGAALA